MDLSGNTDPQLPSVGAHRSHVLGSGNSRKVECSACHLVPERTLFPGHIDSSLPAEVVFDGVATSFLAEPSYDGATNRCADTYCHGAKFIDRHLGGTDRTPRWTDVRGGSLPCDSCHSLPPPAPHPQNDRCGECHLDVALDGTIQVPELHLDGVVTFTLPN
jgi:predicted CxxxxCH...CXXCH cytochrome family protein